MGSGDGLMAGGDDEFLFKEEGPEVPVAPDMSVSRQPWLILIVDDDPEVHAMTRLVMKKFTYRGRPVQFLSAYSAEEALGILRNDPGIAMILLDVVMETDDAGLRLVPRIRDELGNSQVRIILRTGQPGQAPEDDVIHGYDINDYKAKTELTAQKLGTATVAALRSFEHITELIRSRQGMERIIDASGSLFALRAIDRFAEAVLRELARVLNAPVDGLVCVPRGNARADAQILAASGRHADSIGLPLGHSVDPGLAAKVMDVLRARQHHFDDNDAILWLRTTDGRDAVACLHVGRPLDQLERKLAEVLGAKIAIGFDNLHLYEQVKRSHKAAVIALAGLAEYKDPDGGGDHGLRLSRLVTEIAFAMRSQEGWDTTIDDDFLDQITMGAMLYDIGMVGVPDSVIRKDQLLDETERQQMEQHCERGAAILEKASRLVEGSNYLSFGAAIARAHHERWDGSGYPGGLSGTDIPAAARIVAVADVYDALTHRRSWREAVPLADALKTIGDGAGTLFDPTVVAAFFKVRQSRGRMR
ncbi:DUF3369 domain-containing protein [Niveispirillum sp.]|uniref:DUF3369 domain-containing protein n=1 Tax=Niveispirillum sp. TaxID=1917217 RepID=UPI001B3F76FA|nr:DUF3369 domain-containing protein [Niveispirillum sp.]MBP7336064.1 DUF3369 domain-containing protein [Niveispirillum sp.]